ncbi:MAG: FIST C-terminal domain-containing protein, partial [Candidatus Omnitrophica bacterium]|nr:FIST C-terminal domain-containing protein [Candidatus Omnitrophota bacterium]
IYMEHQRQYLIRCPVDILTDGSIVCQSTVPTDAKVHLMIHNKDSCKQAATDAALEARETLEGLTPQLIIIFESVIRHKILGRNLFSEIQAIQEVLGSSVPLIGMYSLGELCPLESNYNKGTYLQNANLLLMAIT